MASRKVLVVDDDRMLQAYLRALFEKAGFEVAAALDAMQGPMVARREKPDLIVLDIAMPGGGGAAVLERLRMAAGTTAIPILIHTSLTKDEVVRHIPEAAHMTFIPKAADPADLLAAAEDALSAGR